MGLWPVEWREPTNLGAGTTKGGESFFAQKTIEHKKKEVEQAFMHERPTQKKKDISPKVAVEKERAEKECAEKEHVEKADTVEVEESTS